MSLSRKHRERLVPEVGVEHSLGLSETRTTFVP
jgi:hypothetical protein